MSPRSSPGSSTAACFRRCHEIFDLRRAHEWTTSFAGWCASQPDLVPYQGECLIHRAELMQLRGAWLEAEQAAHQACAQLSTPTVRQAIGGAFYRLAEIHRLRGELTKAEEAYRQANARGRTTQPGLSLLRLSQGHADLAAASIRSALTDSERRATRVSVLAAAVEIMLAVERSRDGSSRRRRARRDRTHPERAVHLGSREPGDGRRAAGRGRCDCGVSVDPPSSGRVARSRNALRGGTGACLDRSGLRTPR